MKQPIGQMTGPELKFRAKQAMAALIPISGLKDHGPHLAIGTEIEITEEYANKIAQRLSPYVLVTQTIPFEIGGDKIFGLEKDCFALTLKQIANQIKALGIERIIILSFSSDSIEVSKEALKNFNFKQKYINIVETLPKTEELVSESPTGKGNAHLTSLALFLNSYLVKQDMLKYADSSFGVVGDPKKATSEIGKKLYDASFENIVQIIDNFLRE
ncbi:MAG: creatininase family protein [Thermoproteota archaeon]|nr:creatininase family protein [Candidatus Brockarchaeota archaeon]MBO3801335.1 creatininase family protein [Candidatus Brockarchaeota archaeon]